MNRYKKAFAKLAKENRIALIPFAVAGDPDCKTSEKIFNTYIRAGADILEIGYPFSDPIADGPVNQRSAQRAIEKGITPDSFFSMIKRLRITTDIPFGLLMYSNTALNLGYETFCQKASSAGIDSLLIADMPPEEAKEILTSMHRNNLKSVFIVSELTPQNRMRYICKSTTGFIYVVSRLGTTGIRKDFSSSANHTIKKLRALTTQLPLCVGFGISTPDHVAQVRKAGADGAIIGSKLVSIIEKHLDNTETLLKSLHTSIRGFRKATQKAN